MAQIVSGISGEGSIICYIMDATDLVAYAANIHKTTPVATSALGRLLTVASLMGIRMKAQEGSLTLRIKGDGPIGTIVAVSDYLGNVRGYAGNAAVEIPLNQYQREDVAGAIGKGSLTIMRDFGTGIEPYIGTVELVSSEIAEDITAYYAYSEQIPTVCALGVDVLPDGTVRAAGGYIAQLLPGAKENAIIQLEGNIEKLPPMTTMLKEDKTPEEIVDMLLVGLQPKILSNNLVEYRCDCSRERVEQALISLGRDELKLMILEDKQAEVACHFCNKKYHFNKQQLEDLLAQIPQA